MTTDTGARAETLSDGLALRSRLGYLMGMQDMTTGLAWQPTLTLGEDRHSRWLITCDHATNRVPPWVNGGDLGLPAEDMARHIAYDVGASGVAIRLAERLGAPAVLSNFSRLVIDPNRGLDDPTLVMRIYDQSIIPANRRLTVTELEDRIERCYLPYDNEIARLAGRRDDTALVSVHSFTPQLKGRDPRPWHITMLHDADDRLSLALARELGREDGIVIGLNEPYKGGLWGDTLDRHALRQGRQNTLIEIRNDLIADDAGQEEWAARLARALPPALEAASTLSLEEAAQ